MLVLAVTKTVRTNSPRQRNDVYLRTLLAMPAQPRRHQRHHCHYRCRHLAVLPPPAPLAIALAPGPGHSPPVSPNATDSARRKAYPNDSAFVKRLIG